MLGKGEGARNAMFGTGDGPGLLQKNVLIIAALTYDNPEVCGSFSRSK